MIDLRLLPGQVIAGESTELRLRVTNNGPGLCTNVAFTVRVPTGIIRVLGRDKLHIERLGTGESGDLELRVVAERPGRYAFTTRNLSYRDHQGQVRRIPEIHVELAVLAPRQPPPQPRVEVELQTEHLPLGEWSDVYATVTNSSDVGVTDLVVSIGGRVTADSRSRARRIEALGPAASAVVCFTVRADEAGLAVPLHFDLGFSGPAGPPIQISKAVRVAVASDHRTARHDRKPRELRVLVFCANPRGTARLRIDEEARGIEDAVRMSQNRDSTTVEICPATRREDLIRRLSNLRPHFVHLAGHGVDGTFAAQDDEGYEVWLPPEPLAALLGSHASELRCVTVNACSTEPLARELAKHVEEVIAMRWRVRDSAAIAFGSAFYAYIANGSPIDGAFTAGKSAMGLVRPADFDAPIRISGRSAGSIRGLE